MVQIMRVDITIPRFKIKINEPGKATIQKSELLDEKEFFAPSVKLIYKMLKEKNQ